MQNKKNNNMKLIYSTACLDKVQIYTQVYLVLHYTYFDSSGIILWFIVSPMLEDFHRCSPFTWNIDFKKWGQNTPHTKLRGPQTRLHAISHTHTPTQWHSHMQYDEFPKMQTTINVSQSQFNEQTKQCRSIMTALFKQQRLDDTENQYVATQLCVFVSVCATCLCAARKKDHDD